MNKEISERVGRLFLPNKPVVAKNDGISEEILLARDIVYLTNIDGKTFAVKESRKRIELVENLNYYENFYQGYFLRVHRSFLVAVARIEGVFERYPDLEGEDDDNRLRVKADECELGLTGTAMRIPVTETYSKALKKALNITSYSHLVPEHPDDKKLRLYELIDFGWRELQTLDTSDKAAVADFQKKWDIKKFTKKRMLSYFRQYGVNVINKKRVIKNIIYQMFRWIEKGIEPPSDGNIRSLWYRIKAVLAYQSDILGSGDVDTFYSTLQEMVEEEKLFRYKDFGFLDMNEPYQKIGDKRPEVILASEKLGQFLFIRNLANEAGVSFICMKGEPSVLSLEYFTDNLKLACGNKPKTVLCITDVDPSGYSIEGNLVSGLQQNGHTVDRVVKLVDASSFTSEEIAILRYAVVSFAMKGDQVKPFEPATMSQVTKSLNWFKLINDERLISEKDNGDGWKTVNIYGIESDAADRKVIIERFWAGLETPVKKRINKAVKPAIRKKLR